ncbi:MAG: glycosyltransferase family 39 protein [Candidatus Kerfeldbacteria bacterium]|nr:glycosyltransferase family 39 protein [Candidatus Kerfeldbacteria bacterium]
MFAWFHDFLNINPLIFGDPFFSLCVYALIAGVLLWVLQKIRHRSYAREVLIGALGILIVGRVFHFGQIDGFSLSDVRLPLVLGAVCLAAVVLMRQDPVLVEKKQPDARVWKDALIIIALIAVAIMSVWYAGSMSIDGDEIFQFESAVGYIKTGEFVHYDFSTSKPFVGANGQVWEYTRAWGYTWIIAQSMNLFGISELSARLPAIVSFILLVIGMYLVMRAWLKDRVTAALVAFTLVFSNTFIQLGALTRMYEPFFLIFGVTLVCVYLAFRAYTLRQHGKFFFWSLVTIPFYIASMHLQIICLVFIPGFLLFVIVEWIVQYAKHRSFFSPSVAPMTWAMIAALLLSVGMLVVDQFYRYIPWRVIHVAYRNPIYELYGFFDFPIFGLAIALYVIGLLCMFRKSMTMRFMGSTSASLFLIYIFVLSSFPARRYFALVSLLIIPFVVITARDLVRGLNMKRLQPTVAWACVVALLCVPVSIPRVPSVSVFNAAVADSVQSIDYKTAYAYVREHMSDDESLLVVSFRNFYWGEDTAHTIIDMHRNKPKVLETPAKMEALLFRRHSGWIVWPKELSRAKPAVKEYVLSVARPVDELSSTGLEVYRFDMSNKTAQFISEEVLRRQINKRLKKAGFPDSFKQSFLIQKEGDSKLFVVTQGEKRFITSSKVFASCRYVRSDIRSISPDLFVDIPIGEPVDSVEKCVQLPAS